MRDAEVVVIGAGLTGLWAAVTAAARGRRTTVVSAGVGAIAVGSGTIDVLGATGDGQPVERLADGLARLPADHPYTLVGPTGVDQALAAFEQLCAGSGYPYLRARGGQATVVTAAGTTKPSALVPRTMDARELHDGAPVVVLDLPGLKDWFPHLVREGLGQLGERWTLATVEFAHEPGARRDLSALDLARRLDTRAERARFADALRAAVPPGATVLLPPVLGTAPSYTVADELERAVRCRLVEVAGLPPDPSGYRLWQLLSERARHLGVARVENATVTGADWRGRSVRAVVVGGPGQERAIPAERFVLATGGFLGGGLVSDPVQAREPVFDLPLGGAAPGVWAEAELFAPAGQPCARVGVRANALLQPLAEDGAPAAENVLVAGRTLGGFDPSVERSGNGVAVVTGYWAGVRA